MPRKKTPIMLDEAKPFGSVTPGWKGCVYQQGANYFDGKKKFKVSCHPDTGTISAKFLTDAMIEKDRAAKAKKASANRKAPAKK